MVPMNISGLCEKYMPIMNSGGFIYAIRIEIYMTKSSRARWSWTHLLTSYII